MIKKIVIGDEYDNNLRDRLVKALNMLGAKYVKDSWGVGGSQEISVVEMDLLGIKIIIESETYIGLSVESEDFILNDLLTIMDAPL
jgi:hypothetical protein